MAQTIEELLKSMLTLSDGSNNKSLVNSKETWSKIQSGEWATGMDFSSESEKESFLKDWIESNPYSSL